jgi:hypothetical protein
MIAMSPALVRRIDRLSRQAHAFHRFAHHPLCAEYAGEVIALGRRIRVCRGCTYAAAGSVVGLAAGWALQPGWVMVLLWAAAGAAAAATSLVARVPKIVCRFAAAGLGSAAMIGACRATGGRALVLAIVAAAGGALLVLYRHRGPHRGPCLTCSENRRSPVCRGFGPIVRRERAFQRVARRWLDLERATSSRRPRASRS